MLVLPSSYPVSSVGENEGGERTITLKDLALLDLLQEVCLLLLAVGGEALGLGLVYGSVDGLLLGHGVEGGLVMCGAGEAALLAPQFSPEFSARAAAVVEVYCVGCGG